MRELIRLKIIDSLAAQPPPSTRRDVHIPFVKGRSVAVVGPRRAGKTTLLWQVLANRLAAGTPRDGLLYFNFEDERLADITAAERHLVALATEAVRGLPAEVRLHSAAGWLLET